MLARTNRESPAMFTTTSVNTGRIRCLPMSTIAVDRVLAEVHPVRIAAEGRRQPACRSSRSPGRMFRPGPLNRKISMIPSQNVGMAKPT